MPFKPNNPPSKNVLAPTSRAVDTYHIHSFTVVRDPNNPANTQVEICWSKGFIDNGVYIVDEMFQGQYMGPNVIDAINATVTPGNSRELEVKLGLWEIVDAEEDLPDGAVS